MTSPITKHYEVSGYVSEHGMRITSSRVMATPADAQAEAARFPKSYRVVGTRLSTTDEAGHSIDRGYVTMDVKIGYGSKVQGAANEAGMRRLQNFLSKVEWRHADRGPGSLTPEQLTKIIKAPQPVARSTQVAKLSSGSGVDDEPRDDKGRWTK